MRWLCLFLLLTPAVADQADALLPEVRKIFARSCAKCHDDGVDDGGIDFILDLDRVAADLTLVRPGKPSSSELYLQIESGLMPRRKPKLPAAEIATVGAWIDALGVREAARRAAVLAAAPGLQEEAADAAGVEVRVEGPADIELVAIPAGSFAMGSPPGEPGGWQKQPLREVTIGAPFYIATHEISQQTWEQVMGWQPAFHAGAPAAPVESITWFDALAFCNALSELAGLTPVYTLTNVEKGAHRDFGKADLRMHPMDFRALDGDRDGVVTLAELGYTTPRSASISAAEVRVDPEADGFRLPTEAEWEYACRAGTWSTWHGGDELQLDDAVFCGSFERYVDTPLEFARPQPGGSRGANPWGLFDMHGNVAEWCVDGYDPETVPEARVDPVGPLDLRLRAWRGGGFDSSGRACRAAHRDGAHPAVARPFVGLRVVRALRD